MSLPHRESRPGQTSEVAAGEPVFGGYDEEGQAFDRRVDQQPGHRHDGQGHGTEESCLSADSCEEYQDDEHDGWREQGDFDEQLESTSRVDRALATAASAHSPSVVIAAGGSVARQHGSCSVGYTLPLGAGI